MGWEGSRRRLVFKSIRRPHRGCEQQGGTPLFWYNLHKSHIFPGMDAAIHGVMLLFGALLFFFFFIITLNHYYRQTLMRLW